VRALGLEECVRFPGYVPDAALPLWYNSAEVFAYPSLYEGFGLPALEALACGVPVIAASTSAFPEVVGEAGLLVDPESDAALAAALERVLTDPALAGRLRAGGPAHARQFSWTRARARRLRSTSRLLTAEGREWRRAAELRPSPMQAAEEMTPWIWLRSSGPCCSSEASSSFG